MSGPPASSLGKNKEPRTMKGANLLHDIPAVIADEVFEPLLQTSSLKLERIVSAERMVPREQWFDQERDEWVVLLRGGAGLRFEDEAEALALGPGDHVHIHAHRRHRVEWTEEKTVWLALHYDGD
jgi:cupin 2 domain-containing protein